MTVIQDPEPFVQPTDSPVSNLAPPGAGLPFVEAWLTRYIMFPVATRLLSPGQAIAMVTRLGHQALSAAQAMSDSQLTQPVLIDRFPGIEESSRCWSVLMTLHHLLITGEAMAQMVTQLTHGQAINQVVRIEDVKPPTQADADEVFEQYARVLTAYPERITALLPLSHTNRHPHPWFGAITARQWLCLNGIHHQIHWAQIQKIQQAFSTEQQSPGVAQKPGD